MWNMWIKKNWLIKILVTNQQLYCQYGESVAWEITFD